MATYISSSNSLSIMDTRWNISLG